MVGGDNLAVVLAQKLENPYDCQWIGRGADRGLQGRGNKLAEMEAMIQYGSVVLGVAPDGPNPQDMPNLGYRLNQN